MKVFFDGGLRPLPAGMELAVVVAGTAWIERDLGAGSSMEAEWLALLAATRRAATLRLQDVILMGDSAAVIAQACGKARCPATHRASLDAFGVLAAGFERVRLRHVRRSQNLAGIALAAAHAR